MDRFGNLLIAAWLLLAAGQAGWAALHPAAKERFQAGPALWFLLTLIGVANMPGLLQPTASPWQTAIAFAVLGAFPFALANCSDLTTRARNLARAAGHTVQALIAATVVLTTLRFLVAVRGEIASVDFYYYLCAARDLNQGIQATSFQTYFPGGYRFWRTLMTFCGSDLLTLQTAYAVLVLINFVLVAAVVYRVTRRFSAAVFAFALCALGYSLFEGYYGLTEPLVTVWVLLGVLVWNGRWLRAGSDWFPAVALGISIGLAVFCKQQGAFLALGWLALVAQTCLPPPESRHRLVPVLAIPVVALLTLVALLQLEGNSLVKVRAALGATREYQRTEGSRETALLGLLLLGHCLLLPKLKLLQAASARPAFSVGLFCAAAGSAGLLQFAWRSYGHYALLSIPFFIIAAVVSVSAAVDRLAPELQRSPALTAACLLMGCALFMRRSPRDELLYYWPVPVGVRFHLPPTDLAGREAAMAALRPLVPAGVEVLVLPKYRNDVHFHLGTRGLRHPHDYGWPATRGLDDLRTTLKQELFAVLLFAYNQEDWVARTGVSAPEAERALREHGYVAVHTLPAVTIWQRKPGDDLHR